MSADGLVEFLLARIAEDESVAQSAAENAVGRAGDGLWTSLKSTCEHDVTHGPRGSVEATPHRVLAECEAKRRIIDLHHVNPTNWTPRLCAMCGAEWPGDDHTVEWPCPTLRLLALPYADHPDYRQEWKP